MSDSLANALDVCPENEIVTLLFCAFCKQQFQPTNKRQRFCTSKCRVDAHREPHRAKRRRWTAARRFYRVMEFDGRITGSLKNVGPLASFEGRSKPCLRNTELGK
jgi:hypothetical protein